MPDRMDTTEEFGAEAAPAVPLESAEGVDLTLVRWMLSLTNDQRLSALQAWSRVLASARVVRPTP